MTWNLEEEKIWGMISKTTNAADTKTICKLERCAIIKTWGFYLLALCVPSLSF